ncbi:transmembrane protein, partial [Trifolium medium]|nr:transmembrane protein [Trifolium medium]
PEQPGAEAPSAAFSITKTFVYVTAIAGIFVSMVLA